MKKLFTTAICLAFAFTAINAKVYYVSPGGSDTNNGESWATAIATPNEAMRKAASGDEIWFKGGTYILNGNKPVDIDPTAAAEAGIWIKEGVSMYGGFAGTETTIDQRTVTDPAKPWSFTNKTTLTGGTRIDGGANGVRLLDRFDKKTVWQTTTYVDGFEFTQKGKSRNAYFKEKIHMRNCAMVGAEDNNSVIYFEDGGTIENCYFTQCNQPLYIRGGAAANIDSISKYRETMRILDCTFDNNKTFGNFWCEPGYYKENEPPTTPMVLVKGCKFINNTRLFVEDKDSTVLTSTGIYINHTSKRSFDFTENTIENNKSEVPGAAALFITGGGNINIYRNIIRDNIMEKKTSGKAGGSIVTVYTAPTDFSGIKLFNNLITDNESNERSLGNVGGDFINNTIANNTGRIYMQGSPIIMNNIFFANKYSDVETPVEFEDNPAYFPTYSYNANAVDVVKPADAEWDVHDNILITDPGFTNVAAGDYSLLSNSACATVASAEDLKGDLEYPDEFFTTYFTLDLAGNPIVSTANFSAGAYQVGGSAIERVDSENLLKAYSINGAIVLNAISEGSISVYNMNGSLIKQVNVIEGNNTIEMTKGLYIVKMTSNNQFAAVKVLVK